MSPPDDSGMFYPLRIADVRQETADAVCISFELPAPMAQTFTFIQGQYLTLRREIEGQEIRRSYSICSAIGEGTLRIAVKKIEGGVFSTFANESLKRGDQIEVMPPQGEFHAPLDPAQGRSYLCIAAGSGITPVLSIIKTVLQTEPLSRVTLIYGNRTTRSIMFREELSFIKNRFMRRFQWINILSREEQDTEVLNGRVNNKKGADLQRRHLIRIRDYAHFFLCGPESMISEVSRGLRKEGITEDRIHYELFFASAQDARTVVEKHHARALKLGGKSSTITVVADGRSIDFELACDGENILDAALANGADLPFSCKGGVCATCKARLIEGEVDMDLNYALSSADLERGFILCCQAHPLTDRVRVDFDSK